MSGDDAKVKAEEARREGSAPGTTKSARERAGWGKRGQRCCSTQEKMAPMTLYWSTSTELTSTDNSEGRCPAKCCTNTDEGDDKAKNVAGKLVTWICH